MDAVKILGLISGSLTTIAFVPQVIKTYKSRSAKDLSLNMFLIFCAGVIGWFFYGILINDLPVILANGTTLILSVVLIVFKLIYKE